MKKGINYKKIFSKIDRADIISFDIFDTLIKRNITNSTDLFDIVEKEYNQLYFNNKISNFKINRIKAQAQARQKHYYDDYTIEEVYDNLKKYYTPKQLDILLNLEKEVETKFCVPNSAIIPIFEYCLKNNKKIICISDMYFSEEFLKNILEKNNFSKIFKIYVSSEYRKRKHIGNIYKVVIDELGVKPQKILHIGDNYKSDYFQASKFNINAVLIPNIIKNVKYMDSNNKNLDNDIMYNIINNSVDIVNENHIQKIGYEVYGPLFYGFIEWIKKNTQNKKIFFCARDMLIVQEIYSKIYNDSKYFYISRKSVRGAFLFLNNSIEDINSILSEKEISLKQFLKYVNIDEKDVSEIVKKYDFTMDYNINLESVTEKFKSFYCEIRNIVKEINQPLYEVFMKYLDQINFNEDVCLVDTGWNATIQFCLEKIVTDANIHGYYFGLSNLAKKRIDNKKINAYIFDDEANQDYAQKINSIKLLFDLSISATHGSTMGYEQKEDKIVPILNSNIDDYAYWINDLQKGIKNFLEFVYTNKYSLNVDVEGCLNALCNFITKPKLEDVNIFMNFKTDNLEKKYLVESSNNSIIYYLVRPKKFIKELSSAIWKVGFLKSIFKINLPYYQFYTLMKKLK